MWTPKHTPVTDAEYFALLPVHGLLLARSQAVAYLGQAESDSELPTEDTQSDLSLIRSELASRMQQEVRP